VDDNDLTRQAISRRMKGHYETVWMDGDAWSFETSEYEQRRYDAHLAMLDGRRYRATLEIGCGSGGLTRRLATVSDRVVAIDISSHAIERARKNVASIPHRHTIDLHAGDIMSFDTVAHGPWDLVVFSETIYCVGWLYPMFDVAMMASTLRSAMRPGGRLLLSNTYGTSKDWLLQPWLIDTYRDLFRNVGFTLEREEVVGGVKDGIEMRVLMSLFGASA